MSLLREGARKVERGEIEGKREREKEKEGEREGGEDEEGEKKSKINAERQGKESRVQRRLHTFTNYASAP